MASKEKPKSERGTTLYRLNKQIEGRGRKLIVLGFHNTMSDLIEYAVAQHILFLEKQIRE